jgi:hypothetical protein
MIHHITSKILEDPPEAYRRVDTMDAKWKNSVNARELALARGPRGRVFRRTVAARDVGAAS